jgi:IS30 family transposase
MVAIYTNYYHIEERNINIIISKESLAKIELDIKDRPKIVDKKIRIGDFEGDTIIGVRGGDKACLLTLVDRKSKFTIIRKYLIKLL